MKKITLITLLLPFLFSCKASLPTLPDLPNLLSLPKFSVYKKDIHQGSVLEPAKVAQLKIGMTKSEVKNLIGSPSIIDPFHNQQWDYINHSILHKKANIDYRLSLKFDNDILTKINTDGMDSLLKPNAKKTTKP